MPTEKTGDSGKIAADRLRATLPEERLPSHPQNRMRGLGPQGRIPRPDEVTPNTVRSHFSLPPDVELSREATDDVLRATGAMAKMDTEVAPERTHGPTDELSDAPTAEAPAPAAPRTITTVDNRNRSFSVKMDIEIPEFIQHTSTRLDAGLILFIAACVFAMVVFAVGIAMLFREVSISPP